MDGDKKTPATYTLKDLIVAIPVVFLLGVVATTASWRTNVDRTNELQSDSITINAEKYECLLEGYTALQASDRIMNERVTILETRVDVMYKKGMEIQEAIYFRLTGEEWGNDD